MAENKKSFILYCDIIDNIDHLTNEEKGILFQHLLEYVNDLNPVLEDRVLLSSWKPIQKQLKRDLEKWEQKQQQRSLAGKKSAEKRKRNSTVVNGRSNRLTNSTVNDNVNVNVNETLSVYTESEFLKQWNAIRTEETKKPSHLNRIPFQEKEIIKTLNPEDTQNALKGFFKQKHFPRGQDYTVNVKHFLNHFEIYLQAYHDKNPNVWGKE